MRDFINVLMRNAEFADRLDSSVDIVNEGLEPNFFVSRVSGESNLYCSPVYRGGATTSYPLAILSKYLFPCMTEGEIDSIMKNSDREYLERMDYTVSKIAAFVHMHPDNCLQPSKEDLGVADELYGMYTGAGFSAPLIVIGRGTDPADFLFINQRARAPAIIQDIDWLTERSMVSMALPRYMHDPTVGSAVRDYVRAMSVREFVENIKKYAENLPCQDGVRLFRRDFGENMTVFPEYPQAVADALRSIGCYDIGLVRYHTREKHFELLEC